MHIIRSISESTNDIRILWISVFIRMLAFGLCNQVLTLYLASLGISEPQIGVFMTLTMIGDTLLSYVLTWNANLLGNRRIMVAGALVMFLSGLVFASGITNYTILLVAAIFGVISPSGTDTGPFRAIEEGVIARLTPLNHRPEVFAIHGLLSSVGSAIGSIVCGITVDYLKATYLWSDKKAFRTIFLAYGLVAVFKVVLLFGLSRKCEPEFAPEYGAVGNEADEEASENEEAGATSNETSELSEASPLMNDLESSTITGLTPRHQTQLFKLLFCFMLDSFGWGFMPSAWVVYYFKLVFGISATILGTLFFVTSIVSALAGIPSAYLAKSLGPIRSSLLSQIPCGLFSIAIPFCGTHFFTASVFLTLQQLTTGMDVVPRQILTTSLFPHRDVVKALGLIMVGKTAARTIGPIFTGKLASIGLLWVNFLISGGCLIVSNLVLWGSFLSLDEEVLLHQKTNTNFG
ncbi:unnamed protein product [Kuraishia capsulata CBS 1993]|uniref:Major facilitator superfamily (MFS) profile domain-containing protein n=1 Tax=Kuraishia capsulata CBS 1993 TaxID=1382522 RepID=W6MT44_9ASCO|nr:uncharacterized protein KUCA_T00005525001 [Kuraishia capsulata CBS 1993]CDK29533.1 unnamed protein product [Kuraishia capsulata CBS 1993]